MKFKDIERRMTLLIENDFRPGAPMRSETMRDLAESVRDLARAGRTEILEVRGDVKRALREVDI